MIWRLVINSSAPSSPYTGNFACEACGLSIFTILRWVTLSSNPVNVGDPYRAELRCDNCGNANTFDFTADAWLEGI